MRLRLKAYFDVLELYYLPQYLPVAKELEQAGFRCIYVFYEKDDRKQQQLGVIEENSLEVKWVQNDSQAMELYLNDKPDWLLLGNYNENLQCLHDTGIKTGLLSHGIGPKSCYYSISDSNPTVRFVEGPYRKERLKDLYPEQLFVDTGYAKLDPAIGGELSNLKPSDYGLDDSKKTILYAPTFYPSSIECFSKCFPKEFSEYNLILKPHYFSLVSEKYRKQKKLLEKWAESENVYLARENEVNALPFMVVSDVMISDASSTLFEFAALNKPVIWCDFYKLRFGYRGLLRFRFEKRMDEDLYRYADVAIHAASYKELKQVVDSQIQHPEEFEAIRKQRTIELAGKVDGKVSKRIAESILEIQEE